MTPGRVPSPRRDPHSVKPGSLDKMDRTELITLTRRLLRERSRWRGAVPRRAPVDPDEVASSVSEALDVDWEKPSRMAERHLSRHTYQARQNLKAGQWEPSLATATGIVQGFADGYDPENDYEGDLAMDLHEALATVDKSLNHVRSGRLRSAAFGALLEIWWTDMGHGGIGLADDVPGILRKRASNVERARLADRVLEHLPETSAGFEREHGARLFLDLDGGRFKDPTYLEFCQTNGLHMERVARLVARRRYHDAVNIATVDVPHYRLTDAADLLVRGGHPDLAVAMVEKGLQDQESRGFHDRWKSWLLQQAQARSDLSGARKLAWEIFLQHPTLQAYLALRGAARKQGSWEADEGEVLRHLRRPDLGGVLTQVHLDEDRVKEAMQSFRSWAEGHPQDWSTQSLQREVAQAAQKDHPGDARDLYRDLAERLISLKTRGAYSQAAPLVKMAGSLGDRAGDGDGTKEILKLLYRRYPRFPALWDELKRVGLHPPLATSSLQVLDDSPVRVGLP